MKVYISGCTRTSKRTIERVASLLESSGHHASFYVLGNEYSSESLEKSDAVVFVLPERFECPLSHMSQGSLKELIYCLNNRKDIYISYDSQAGLRIYAARITENLCIKGIEGTYMNLDIMAEIKEVHDSTESVEKSTEYFY